MFVKSKSWLTIFSVSLAVFLSGCVYHNVNTREMVKDMQAIKQEKNSVFSILWYRGSDAEYDYFSHVYSMTGTKNFKVPIGELILPRIEFTDDYQKWFLIKEIEGLWSASTLGADDKWKPDTEGVSIQFINQNGTVSPPN